MLGPDPDQQRRMAGEMDRSIEQIERETSAVLKRLDWLWWIAVPIAVVSLAVPLLFRRFLIGRLEQVRGQFGMFGGQGETIDGSWHDAEPARRDPPRDEPAGVIIDQRPRGDGDD